MAFPDSFLQELKLRSDITEIASSYVNLKRNGRNMVGLCPFHGEKTPSFNIYTESGSFYCFGCGVGGDVITFVIFNGGSSQTLDIPITGSAKFCISGSSNGKYTVKNC